MCSASLAFMQASLLATSVLPNVPAFSGKRQRERRQAARPTAIVRCNGLLASSSRLRKGKIHDERRVVAESVPVRVGSDLDAFDPWCARFGQNAVVDMK